MSMGVSLAVVSTREVRRLVGDGPMVGGYPTGTWRTWDLGVLVGVGAGEGAVALVGCRWDHWSGEGEAGR